MAVQLGGAVHYGRRSAGMTLIGLRFRRQPWRSGARWGGISRGAPLIGEGGFRDALEGRHHVRGKAFELLQDHR